MARPLRLELAGGLYYVTTRGDHRADIHADDDDRQAWLDLFGSVCARFNWRCHAYCQMNNHYHLLVETPDANLARGMRQLNGVYTQYFNRRHGEVGHLFQGRYQCILVEKDDYLAAVARHIVLNPVRIGAVADPGKWHWSSYPATVGRRPPPQWLALDELLHRFATRREVATRRYADFVHAGIGLDGPWSELKAQVFLGSEAFVARMQSRLPEGDLREVPGRQRGAPPRPLSAYGRPSASRESRDAAMASAYADGHYSLREIGDHFGVHYSTVSRAVRRNERRSARGRA